MFTPPPGADDAIRAHLVNSADIAARVRVERGAVSNWLRRYPSLAALVIVRLDHGGPLFWWPQVAAELDRLGLPDRRYGRRRKT